MEVYGNHSLFGVIPALEEDLNPEFFSVLSDLLLKLNFHLKY